MPIEPLYPLRVAAELIPMSSVVALYSYLQTRKDQFPPRYRRARRGYMRLLTESEVLRIRADVVKPRRKHSG